MALRRRSLIPSVVVAANVPDVTLAVSVQVAESVPSEALVLHVRSALPVRALL